MKDNKDLLDSGLDLLVDTFFDHPLLFRVNDQYLSGGYRSVQDFFNLIPEDTTLDRKLLKGQAVKTALTDLHQNVVFRRTFSVATENFFILSPETAFLLCRGMKENASADRIHRRITPDHIPVTRPDADWFFEQQLNIGLRPRRQFLIFEQHDPAHNLSRADMHPDACPVLERLLVAGKIDKVRIKHV